MTAEGSVAGLANCTSANVVVRVINMVILTDVHGRKLLVVEGVDLVAVIDHWTRSRNHGLRSGDWWIERYITGDTIIVETASRLRARGGLKSHCSYRQHFIKPNTPFSSVSVAFKSESSLAYYSQI